MFKLNLQQQNSLKQISSLTSKFHIQNFYKNINKKISKGCPSQNDIYKYLGCKTRLWIMIVLLPQKLI